MRHYFSQDWEDPRGIQRIPFRFKGESFLLETADGIFSRSKVDRGTELLLSAAYGRMPGGRLLDLCCGYGVVGIVLSRLFPQVEVTLCDVNFLALRLTQSNLRLNRSKGHVICADGVTAFMPRSFDAILVNPPLRIGKDKVMGLLETGLHALRPDGRLYFVARTGQGVLSLAKGLERAGAGIEEIERGSGFRVFASQREKSP